MPVWENISQRYRAAAAFIIVAASLFSCKESLQQVEISQEGEIPSQVVDEMYVQQSQFGKPRIWVYAPRMERYTKSENPYDTFPQGIRVKAYTEDGLLETEIVAKSAMRKTIGSNEKWEAYGDVKIDNYIKGETMETDTLYWDRKEQKIFTHCFVKLRTPDFYMQGYGMESDEMARNAIILKPFDSYGIVKRDSTEQPYLDTANFIGPLIQRRD